VIAKQSREGRFQSRFPQDIALEPHRRFAPPPLLRRGNVLIIAEFIHTFYDGARPLVAPCAVTDSASKRGSESTMMNSGGTISVPSCVIMWTIPQQQRRL